jgi:hypothetical protein
MVTEKTVSIMIPAGVRDFIKIDAAVNRITLNEWANTILRDFVCQRIEEQNSKEKKLKVKSS